MNKTIAITLLLALGGCLSDEPKTCEIKRFEAQMCAAAHD